MADLGLPPPPKAAHGRLLTLLLPMQVKIPWTKQQRSESDEMRTKRTAWIKSLATFMASQPASCQMSLLSVHSSDLPATQALSPWTMSLRVYTAQEDDIGKVLKGVIEVGQRSLAWGALPVS
jgi:hypothetical protein